MSPLLTLKCSISYIFIPMLVSSKMDSPERPSANLLLDHVLIDAMNGTSVVFTIGILRTSMQSLFDRPGTGSMATVVSQRTLVGG